MARPKYMVIDAFTAQPYSGNPAAVMPLAHWPADAWLQSVAAEINLAETAFLVPESDGWRLRWFTPRVEVDLCGHATLAAAAALAHGGKLADGTEVRFATRSGVLPVMRQGKQYQLDFPRLKAEPAEAPEELLAAIGARPQFVGKNPFDFLVEVASAEAVRSLAPDFRKLALVAARGMIVTAPSDDPQFDFVSRFFAPAAGIDEDPVTGSAHCCLADHWGQRLGKSRLTGFQASARGGVVDVETRGDRVLLRGQAALVAQGEWLA